MLRIRAAGGRARQQGHAAMLLLRHQPHRQLALRAGDGGRGSSLPALRLQQRRAGADATTTAWGIAGPWSGGMGPTRGLAGGFFDQLRQSFKQEVEKNKEFKESLSKLKKETGDITGKAQEGSSKLQESLGKYTEAFTSKLSETGETLAKSTQAIRAQVEELKEKASAASATAKKEEEKMEEEAASAARARTAATAVAQEEEQEPPVVKASSSTSTWTEEKPPQQQQQGTEGEGGAQQAKASAFDAEAGAGEGAKEQQQSSTAQEGGASAAAGGSFFERLLKGRPPQEAAVAWAKEFRVGLSDAWADLFGLNKKETGMKKHIYQQRPPQPAEGAAEGKEGGEEAEAAAEAAVGGGALVVVKQQQKTWERLAQQLKDAPIIQEILKAGTKLADTELGRQAGKLRGQLKDRVEDAREVWETSQNPLVYKLSSVWDDLTSETELGIALREIRRADPDFVLEDWVGTLSERFLPVFFKAYLKGDLKALQPYLSEGMYKQMAEEFRLRKGEGLALDPNVLEISNAEIVQAKMHDHQPVLVLGALIQHINCVRDREGKVVEGKEDEVRASFYLLLFVREYNEAEGALEWKVSERYLGFSQPFI